MRSDYNPSINNKFDKNINKTIIFIGNIKTEYHIFTKDLIILVNSVTKLERDITTKKEIEK
jgi:hypothetical protein